MVASWSLYLMALVAALWFYIIYPPWVSWYLLVVALLLPVFDLLVSLPGMLLRRVSISAPPELERGARGMLAIATHAPRMLPAGRIFLRLRVSSEDGAESRRAECSGYDGGRSEIEIDTSVSGMTAFELPRIWTSSLLGFFRLTVPLKCRVAVLVMPAAEKPPRAELLPQGGSLLPKPGGGFAEEHDIRPYRQGDPLNSVHWKLSAKHDELIIREALMQPPHSRLVQCEKWSTARERDLILGRLRWISERLLEHDCPHYVRIGESGETAEIARPGELGAFLRRTLDRDAKKAATVPNLPARFTWVFRIDAGEAGQ